MQEQITKNNSFFSEAFLNLTPVEREDYHRTVFLNMDTPKASGLRREYYRGLLRQMGANVHIGRGIIFINPQNISVGDNVFIDDHCTIIANSERGITLGESAVLKYGVYLDTEGGTYGYIEIGARAYIGTGCCLHGHQGLEIGEDALLAQNIPITPYSHKFEDPNQTIGRQGGHMKKVVIGRDCYIGMGVCVLWSADIGDGSVIGSGAVVVKPVPPFSVAAGVPARIIRKRVKSNQIINELKPV